MSKYEKYKPSGIDWIGEVPFHWQRQRIKTISENLDGKRVPLNSAERFDVSGDIPYYGATGIVDYVSDFLFDEELVLIGEDGAPFFEPIKDVSFIIQGKSWVNNHAHVLRCYKNRITPKFLMHWLNVVDYANHIKGSTRDKLNQKDLGGIEVYSPILSEQLTISIYLDDQTQKIDLLIANKKGQAEKLKELRQIEINNAVTKGLNPNAELKDSGIDWLGEIPKHWTVKRLKNVSNFIQTGITPPSEKSEYYDGDIPWYGPGGFSGDTILSNPAKYITQKAIDDNEAKLFPIDCIFMIGIGATIGKVGIIKEPSSCNQQLNIVNFKNYVSPDFGVYLLKTYENIIIKIANFSTLPIYNQVQTGNLKFLLPPKEEQLQIAKYLQERTAAIDKLIMNIDTQIEKLQELRKIIIYEAVTGKIKVNAYVEATA